jgi:S-adenosylmethionine synthetase
VIRKIGYTKSEYMFEANSCGILSAIHEQSADINQGVDKKKKEEQGAGDQGMMFGYSSNETEDYMPLALDIAHKILIELAALRRENKAIQYLRPDAKSQVTLEYDDNNKPVRIDAIVVSTQHDDFDSEAKMLAGGQTLIPTLKQRLASPDTIGVVEESAAVEAEANAQIAVCMPSGQAELPPSFDS